MTGWQEQGMNVILYNPGDPDRCMHWVLLGLHAFHRPFEEHPNDNLPPRNLRYIKPLITSGSKGFQPRTACT